MCALPWPNGRRLVRRRQGMSPRKSRAGEVFSSASRPRAAGERQLFAFRGSPHNLCGVKGSDSMAKSEGWESVSSRTDFRDDHLEVVTEEVRSPARQEPKRWTVVRRKRAVIIAPMTADGKLVLIRQERIPGRAAIWEVPGGQ